MVAAVIWLQITAAIAQWCGILLGCLFSLVLAFRAPLMADRAKRRTAGPEPEPGPETLPARMPLDPRAGIVLRSREGYRLQKTCPVCGMDFDLAAIRLGVHRVVRWRGWRTHESCVLWLNHGALQASSRTGGTGS
jgi:hypothetical protein